MSVPNQYTSNLEVALLLAEAGVKVFPARASNKRPHITGWQDKATTDKRTIRRWWRKWPEAAPALPTGNCNGFDVLDLDNKNDKNGMVTLLSLGYDHASMSSAIISTPTGGKHIYFKHRKGLRSSAGKIGSGVDVRADGGYVIAPGSKTQNGVYGRLSQPLEHVFPDLPEWPEDLVPETGNTPWPTSGKTGLNVRKFRDALMHIPNDETNPEAEGRDYWFKIMCGVHHETDGCEEGLDMILKWSEQHPSFDYDETIRVWASLGRVEGGATGATVLSEAKFRGNWVDMSALDELFNDNPLAEIDAMLNKNNEEDEKVKSLGSRYDLTEDGIIRAFADRHEGELLYDHSVGAWFRFVRHYWVREDTMLAKHYARAVSTELAKRDGKAKHLKKVHVWEAVERGAKTVRAFSVNSKVWDKDSFLLGTPGGVVDLRTGKLRSGRPSDRISKITGATPVALATFDPNRDCPRWLAFLNEALGGDAEGIRFFQQWFGYCLTGDISEHALVFVYGPGGSGKSTALNVMAELMADYAINVATSTLTKTKHDAHPEELARMDGARLAFASETEKGKQWAENRIKSLTGGDKITARYMRQNSFEFVPQMKLVIVGNNQPSLSDVDTAIKRRFNILPFENPPKRKDAKLMHKLRSEFPGILAWAIQGALDWQENGLARPDVVKKATQEYFDAQDTFGRWLEEHCETGPAYQDTSEDLWGSWLDYANANGEDPGSKTRTFPETLKQRGFISVKNVRGKRGRGFKGIRLRQEGFDGDELL
jgi:P4 family phage/plasmid primase-like protien